MPALFVYCDSGLRAAASAQEPTLVSRSNTFCVRLSQERKSPGSLVPGLSACRAAPCKPQALRVGMRDQGTHAVIPARSAMFVEARRANRRQLSRDIKMNRARQGVAAWAAFIGFILTSVFHFYPEIMDLARPLRRAFFGSSAWELEHRLPPRRSSIWISNLMELPRPRRRPHLRGNERLAALSGPSARCAVQLPTHQSVNHCPFLRSSNPSIVQVRRSSACPAAASARAAVNCSVK
jgi:hypothetical protein